MSEVFATTEMKSLKHIVASLLAMIHFCEVPTNHLHPTHRVALHETLDLVRSEYEKPTDTVSTVQDFAEFQVVCGRLLFLTDFVLVDHLSEINQAKWKWTIESVRKALS